MKHVDVATDRWRDSLDLAGDRSAAIQAGGLPGEAGGRELKDFERTLASMR